MTRPNACENEEKLDYQYIVGGNVKSYCLSGNSLSDSYKTKNVIITYPAIAILEIHPKEMKNVCIPKNLYTNVHSSFICNSQNLGGEGMYVLQQWIVQLVHPSHRILLSNKTGQTTDTQNNLDKSPGNYVDYKSQPLKVT